MHAEAERRAACCELVSDVARHSGEVCLKLTGTSMLPAMWPGDIVTVRTCKFADLRPGQILLYRGAGGLVAHRIIRSSTDHLLTRGDSVPCDDPPVRPSSVVGYVSEIVRNRRSIPVKYAWRDRALAAMLRRSDLCLRLLLRLNRRTDPVRSRASAFAPSEAF